MIIDQVISRFTHVILWVMPAERTLPSRFVRAPMHEVLAYRELISHEPWPRLTLPPLDISTLRQALAESIADRSPLGMRDSLWPIADRISAFACGFGLVDSFFTRTALWLALPTDSVASNLPHTDESLDLPERENGNAVIRATVSVSEDGQSGGTIFSPGRYRFTSNMLFGIQIQDQASTKPLIQLREGEVGFFTELDVHWAPRATSNRGLLSLTFEPSTESRFF